MKTNLLKLSLAIFAFVLSTNVTAQTPGTLTFTYNQPIPTSPAPNKGIKNIIAIWIENAAGTFIKTRIKRAVTEVDHLPTWSVKSGGILTNSSGANSNVTDAVIGATLSGTTTVPAPAYGTRTINWDGKNVNGAVNGTTVADGDYKVWIESSWVDSGINNHGTIASFTFTKGPTAQHLTPTSPVTYFNTVIIDWVPTAMATNAFGSDNLNANVYPNPSNGVFNIDFNADVTNVKVINLLGQKVIDENVNQASGTSKSIDLSSFENGMYVISLSDENGKSSNYKVVLNK